MQRLTTDLVSQACRLFVPLAYPSQPEGVPAKKQCFLSLPSGQSMFAYLEDNPTAGESCEVLRKDGRVHALLVRLGCKHYAHLKLKAQLADEDRGGVWVFSVDTHDAFSKTNFLPPPDHPEAAAWMRLQALNVALKERVEAAWEQAGLVTFNGLLRRDLDEQPPLVP